LSPSLEHVEPVVGAVPGHVPQTQLPPPPPPMPPPAHVQSVPPYVQEPSAAHAPPLVWQAPPSGCDAGHAGHVVHVQTGLPPPAPPQSHATLP
jgi:hypothetical protein